MTHICFGCVSFEGCGNCCRCNPCGNNFYKDKEDTDISKKKVMIEEEIDKNLIILKSIIIACHECKVDYDKKQTKQNYEELIRISNYLNSSLWGLKRKYHPFPWTNEMDLT